MLAMAGGKADAEWTARALRGGLPPMRPDQANQLPVSRAGSGPAPASPVVVARRVIIVGPSGGLFVYSPTAAAGNLIDSIAAMPGTDQYGNAYQQDIASYATGVIFGQLSGGQLVFGSLSASTRIVTNPSVFLHDALTDATAPGLFLTGPQTVTAQTAGISLYGESKDVSQLAQAVIGLANPAGITSAFAEIHGDTRAAAALEIVPVTAAHQILGTQVSGDADDRFQIDGNGGLNWGSGAAVTDTSLHRLSANSMSFKTCDLSVESLSRGLRVREGADCKQGIATLAAGTVTVANASTTATSRIFLTAQDNNSTGALRVSARTAGTSFTITSSNAADSGVVAYQIFEPA
jgi:hypothetical protein